MRVVLGCGTTVKLVTILWVYQVCCHAQLWSKCNGFSSLSCSRANKVLYVSYGRWFVTNPVGHTHMLCCGFSRTSSWVFVHVWVLCWVLFLLWLLRHVIALPKVIQCPCVANRDDTCMGTCYKYHVMDVLCVTSVMILKSSSGDTQHLLNL